VREAILTCLMVYWIGVSNSLALGAEQLAPAGAKEAVSSFTWSWSWSCSLLC